MKPSRILRIAALGTGAIGILLFLFSFIFAYDPESSNYFFNGALLPAFAIAFSALAVVLCIAGAIFGKKDDIAMPTVPCFAPLVAATGALVSAILFLTLNEIWPGILLLAASAFFILEFFAIAKKYSGWVLWLGFAAIAGVIFPVVSFYFDMSLEMNAPLKILLLFGLLMTMLTITVECRIMLGRFDKLFSPVILLACFVISTAGGAVGFYLLLSQKAPDKTLYLAVFPLLLGAGATALIRFLKLILPVCKPFLNPVEEEPQQGEAEE